MATIEEWLEEDNTRMVLLDISYHNGTEVVLEHFSSFPYVMRKADRFTFPINGNSVEKSSISYDDIISSVPQLISRIDETTSIGSIELYNTDGEYDYLFDINNAWEGHSVKLYLGDASWSRGQFILILDGITNSFSAPTQSSISIGVRDRKDLLDVPVQEQLITEEYVKSSDGIANDGIIFNTSFSGDILNTTGGVVYRTWDPALAVIPDSTLNTHVPICLGQCFNVEPVLIDAWNHVYQVHEGQIKAITEVRSNGVVLNTSQYEVDISMGLLRLLVNDRSTQITCDVSGQDFRADGYDALVSLEEDSAAHLIEWLVLEKAGLTSDLINSENFAAFSDISTLGLYIRSEDTVLNAISEIAQTVGGFIRFGKATEGFRLELLQLIDPVSEDYRLTIHSDDTVEGGLVIQDIEVPKKSIALGYAKNFTIQDKGSLAGVVTEGNIELLDSYTSESKTVVGYNDISVAYPLAEDSDIKVTLYANSIDAQVELDRRLILRNKKRYVYRLETAASPFTINVGDVIRVYNTRYGFSTGKNCLVIGITERPTEKRVNLEIWA